jgi:23S rRNA maturation-related 3'-5' exoribonuclease YhaM
MPTRNELEMYGHISEMSESIARLAVCVRMIAEEVKAMRLVLEEETKKGGAFRA